MVNAIKSKNSNLTLRNVAIRGFNKAVTLENSNLNLINSELSNNRIGIESMNSKSKIYNSTFINNKIDIIAKNSTVRTMNTVVKNVIIEVDKMLKAGVDVRTNPLQVKAQSFDYLKTKDVIQRRMKFKKLLKQIQVYAGYGTQFYALLKFILGLFGITLP